MAAVKDGCRIVSLVWTILLAILTPLMINSAPMGQAIGCMITITAVLQVIGWE